MKINDDIHEVVFLENRDEDEISLFDDWVTTLKWVPAERIRLQMRVIRYSCVIVTEYNRRPLYIHS